MRNCEKKSGYTSRCYNECICGPPVNWLNERKKLHLSCESQREKKSMLNIQNTFVRLQTHRDVNIQLTMKNPFRFYANCDENIRSEKQRNKRKKNHWTLTHKHNQYSLQPGTIQQRKTNFPPASKLGKYFQHKLEYALMKRYFVECVSGQGTFKPKNGLNITSYAISNMMTTTSTTMMMIIMLLLATIANRHSYKEDKATATAPIRREKKNAQLF